MPLQKLEQLYSNIVEIRFTDNPLGINLKEKKFEENWDFRDMKWADIVMTNNISNFGGQYTARIVGKAKEFGKVVHYDTDDLLTELYEGHRLKKVYEEGLSDLTKFIYNHSDIVTVTQAKFAERIIPFMGNTMLAIHKNAIDYDLECWQLDKISYNKKRPVRVGWVGGIHHEEDVKEFAAIPHLVNQRVGKERVQWDFYGRPPIDPTGKEKWQQDVWDNYTRTIMKGFKGASNCNFFGALPSDKYGIMYANMDIAVAPLQMNAFNDSKCLGLGEKIIDYNGLIKNVEDIKIGDYLIGPDGQRREVLSLSRGKDEMVMIIPKRGKPFKVTKDHILSLKLNDKKTLSWKKSKYPKYLNITVRDYLKSNKFIKTNYRLYKTGVDFPINNIQIDPYMVGIMLGDGTLKGYPAITTMDQEIVDYFKTYIKINHPDLSVKIDRKPGNKAATYRATKIKRNNHISNQLLDNFEKLGLKNVTCGDKFIPHDYKVAPDFDRARLLAGLMDTDGCLSCNGTAYLFSNKSKQLVDDVAFVARSLGLYASPVQEFKVPNVCNTSYYKTQLSGDVNIIPCKLPRKQAKERKCNRDPLTTSFRVEDIGIEEYYGFKLDKDGLFLLDDFTVTHNSEIKVAECGRYGVPLIGSNVGCYEETIKNGKTGYLIDNGPKSRAEWVKILTKVIKDRAHRENMGANLKTITDEYFDINKVVHFRLDLYEEFYKVKGITGDQESVTIAEFRDPPRVNIITRTSGRPEYFKECYQSIREQTYENWYHIITADDEETINYVAPLTRDEDSSIGLKVVKEERSGFDHFPYNLYINEAYKFVDHGWVMFLDDDDIFISHTSLESIANQLVDEDALYIWKVEFPDKVIPSSSFGIAPVYGDIASIGWAFHSKHMDKAVWDNRKAADFRCVEKLFNHLRPVWIDSILTKINYNTGWGGSGMRADKNKNFETLIEEGKVVHKVHGDYLNG